jgi:hypothetical protein
MGRVDGSDGGELRDEAGDRCLGMTIEGSTILTSRGVARSDVRRGQLSSAPSRQFSYEYPKRSSVRPISTATVIPRK